MADGLDTALGKTTSEDILDGEVATADLASASVTAAKQAFVGTGSPTVFGNSVQIGEFVASAGSVGTINFPTAFAAAPTVLVSVVGGISAHPSVSAGSAVVNVETASSSGTWIAIGSGAL